MTNKHKLAYRFPLLASVRRATALQRSLTGRYHAIANAVFDTLMASESRLPRRGCSINCVLPRSVILGAFPPAIACVNGSPLPPRMTARSSPGGRRLTILHSGALSLFLMLLASVTAHAQSPAGPNRPTAVPDGYLITPFGYFHPSCVREVAGEDTLLSDVPAIQHAHRAIETLAPCQYPHYTASGEVAVESFGESAQPAGGGTWIENANVTADAGTSYGRLTATWAVPPPPTTNHNQTIYLFPGLENTVGSTIILQPVLAWQGSTGAWDLASWNCCPAGITWHSAPVRVKAGNRIKGTVTQNCQAGTQACPTWNVSAADATTGTSSNMGNTTSSGQTFNWAFGGVLEAYNVTQCSDYPGNAQTVFSGLYLYDYNLKPIANPQWSPTINSPNYNPQCGYAVQVANGQVGVDYAPFLTLHSFNGTDGANPAAGLVGPHPGELWGTTYSGGASNYGTVFNITTIGAFTSMHSFAGPPEGQNPEGILWPAIDDNLYGATVIGGANGQNGTIFQITPIGALTTLYSFCSQAGCADGQFPTGGVTYDNLSGDIYGTTSERGPYNEGTVFQFTGGTLTTLYGFCGQPPQCPDGKTPGAGLIWGNGDTLYGTTQYGGAHGEGTLFGIVNGALTTLYNFCSQGGLQCTDGAVPGGSLLAPILYGDNNLYGTTTHGGPNTGPPFYQGVGTVFKISLGGALTTLYTFCSEINCTDGAYPNGGLIRDSDGNLYGTTSQGGAYNQGTVFKLTPAGALTTVYSFCSQSGCPDGAQPYGDLIQLSDGDLYGTTYYGGASNLGTVFRLHP